MKKKFFPGMQQSLVISIFIATGIFLAESICAAQEKPKMAREYLYELQGDETHGAMNQPAGVSLHRNGDIFVIDTINSRVVAFNEAGKLKLVFGKPGEGPGELKAPMALAVDSGREKVYVADSSSHRVQVFKTNGEFLSTIDLNKGIEEGAHQVRPIGVAVNKEGDVYVSDADNSYIRVYSSDGKYLNKFGGFGAEEGKFAIPVGLFIDGQDQVYVVDMNNARLQVFNKDGKFLFAFGEMGDTQGSFAKPKNVCVDEKGLIYVSDGANLVVQVFDQKGAFIDVIGAEKDVDLQFASPCGVAVANNRLYVTDRWRNSIRVFNIQLQK